MLITAIIKNTRVAFGVCENGRVISSFSLASDELRTSDEYALLIERALARKSPALSLSSFSGAVVASVFPPLTRTVCGSISELTAITPLVVGPGVKSGLDIRVEQHTQLGADIVAAAAGAQRLLSPPYAVMDFDDALTIAAVNPRGELCGVVIAVGAGAAVKALAESAELPLIELHTPEGVLGRNTESSMNSGILYGCASMCDGLTERIRAELGCESLKAIATGRYAPLILPLMKTEAVFNADLALIGLAAIYENDRKKRRA